MKTQFYGLIGMLTGVCLSLTLKADTIASDMTSTVAPSTEIIIGYPIDQAPYAFLDDEGRAGGLMVELWRQRLSGSNLSPQWRPYNSGDEVDLLLAPANVPANYLELADSLTISPRLYRHNSIKDEALSPYVVGVVSGLQIDADKEGLSNLKHFASPAAMYRAAAEGLLRVFIDLPARGELWQQAGLDYSQWSARRLPATHLSAFLHTDSLDYQDDLHRLIDSLPKTEIESIKREFIGAEAGEAELVIAAQTGIPPYIDIGNDGQLHGLYIDIWQTWSRHTGVPIRFLASDMQRSLKDVTLGLADVQIGYPQSASEQIPYLDTAWQIYGVTSRIFMPLDKAFHPQGKGEILGLYRTAPYQQELLLRLPEASIKIYDSAEGILDALARGEITAFVAAARWTESLLVSKGIWHQYQVHPHISFATRIDALIPQSRPLLKRLVADGFADIPLDELASVEAKWVYGPRDRFYASKVGQMSLSSAERRYLEQLGQLTVGYLTDWAPFEFALGDEMRGINAQVFTLLADRLGIGLQTRGYNSFVALQQALRAGDVQLIGSLQPTADRLQDISFTDSYWPSPWAVASLDDSAIVGLSQLSGKRVTVVEGYHLAGDLMQLQPQVSLSTVADVDEGLQLLKAGQTELVIGKLAALSWAIEQQGYDFRLSLLTDVAAQRSHIGVNNQYRPLVPLINRALAQIEDHEMKRINEYWVAGSHKARPDSHILMAGIGLGALMVGVVFSLLWRRKHNQPQLSAEQLRVPGVVNRTILDDRLQQAVLLHQRQQQRFAVMFITIDGLSQAEHKFGREPVQAAYQRMLARVAAGLRKSDTLACFNPGELVLLFPFIQDEEQLGQLAKNIKSLLLEGDSELEPGQFTVQTGIAFYPRDGADPIELLTRAAAQTQAAVTNGPGTYVA